MEREPDPPLTSGSLPDVSKLVARQPWDDLIPHVLRAGADVEVALPRLRAFGERLLQWNRGVSNLISRNDEPRFVERHVRESIEPAHWLRESGATRWLDLGSGGGLPAIPLALVGVGEHWTLVESRRMKTLFLRKAVQDLRLDSVEVVCARFEAMGDPDPVYDGFTSRATLALGPSLVAAAPWIRAGGKAFLWKGSRREEEMAEDPRWKESWEFDGLLGVGSGQTVICRFARK